MNTIKTLRRRSQWHGAGRAVYCLGKQNLNPESDLPPSWQGANPDGKGPGCPPPSPRHGTNLVGECCSESELCERAGGLLLRFTQAFSLGGGAGITFRGCFSSFGLELGEGASSSLVNVSFSKDFSLSLLRVAAGETRTNVGSQAKLQEG